MIPTKKYNPTKRSGHTFDLQHINDTECFRLDDRVLDAFFLGLPGRCRRKTRCSAFNFDALCQRINEATHKKKTCCCNLPKQPLLELLAEAKSLRFWCLLLGLRLLALPPTTDSTKMCLSHVFQMLATKIIPEKKKETCPATLSVGLFPQWYIGSILTSQQDSGVHRTNAVFHHSWKAEKCWNKHMTQTAPLSWLTERLLLLLPGNLSIQKCYKAATGRWKHWWKIGIKSLIHISFISKQHRFC